MTEPATVPLYLLGGPLGAGKTTLLLRLLAYWKAQGKQVGVLMNEAGAISVDGAHAAPLAAAVRNITGGCVCCDARDGILAGLTELVVQRSVDIVVLECSGIAAIEDVIDAVTDPLCLVLTTLAKVIAVIEPAVPSPGHAIGSRYTAFVRYADEVVVNKQDLYALSQRERLCAALVRDNREARVWQVSHAAVDPALLLQPRKPQARRRRGNVVFGSALAHPMVTTVSLPRPVHRGRFTDWFARLPTGVERVKGVCRFSGDRDLYEIQFSSPVTRWVGIVRFQREPDPALVMIGRNYDQERCGRMLQACLCLA